MSASVAIRVAAFLPIITTALWFLCSATAGEPTCLGVGGMEKALLKGNFSGPLVCSTTDAQFVLAGLTSGPAKYAIYDYRYRVPASDGQAMHGGQRILIFSDGEYIGQYSMSPPPNTVVTVDASLVVLSKDGADTVRVDFSMGPPARIFFDGEAEEFYR